MGATIIVPRVADLVYRGGSSYNEKTECAGGCLIDNYRGLENGHPERFSVSRASEGANILPFWGPLPDPKTTSPATVLRMQGYRDQVAYDMVYMTLYLHLFECEAAKADEDKRKRLDVYDDIETITKGVFKRFSGTFLHRLSREVEEETITGPDILNWLRENTRGTEYEVL